MKECTCCGKSKDESDFYTGRSQCKECRNLYVREWMKLHPKNVRETDKRWNMRNSRKRWVYSTLTKHRQKAIVNVSIDELFEKASDTNYCPICGVELDWSANTKSGKTCANSPSLDRVHVDKTLNIVNVMIVCNACNTGKFNGSLDEYIKRCKRIASRFSDG